MVYLGYMWCTKGTYGVLRDRVHVGYRGYMLGTEGTLAGVQRAHVKYREYMSTTGVAFYTVYSLMVPYTNSKQFFAKQCPWTNN